MLLSILSQTTDNVYTYKYGNSSASKHLTSEVIDLSEWLWINNTRCDSLSHDLPRSNDLFVGRSDDMMKIGQLMNIAHIISINGAPGFGKSQLAIHVGYEMLKRGTNVRYIDAVEKLSYLKTFNVESAKTFRSHKSAGFKRTTSEQKLISSPKSLTKRSRNFLTAFVREDHFDTDLASDRVLDQLLKWSSGIDCLTVLILDNCDDIIFYEVLRERLIELIKAMINNSNNHLYVLITSRQQIILLDDFESIVIKELSLAASIDLLLHLSPGISRPHAEQVALLVEGCPLALKVVGKLLHKQEDTLTKSLEDELLNRPMRVLDKASIQKERFSAIMDVVYRRLSSELRQCGYCTSLFNGSFEHQTGLAILPAALNAQQCLEGYVENSLLDKFTLEQLTLYKMHRLIREYFRGKGNHRKNSYYYRVFEKNFCKYFTNYVLQYAQLMKEGQVTQMAEYAYTSQLHNIHNFFKLVLSKDKHSTKELLALVFAVSEEILPVASIKKYFHILISNVNETCYYIKAERCGKFISFIIKELYQECRCTTAKDYFLQMFVCPCMDLFHCDTIAEISQNLSVYSQLDKEERDFLFRINNYHCATILMNEYHLNFYYTSFSFRVPSILFTMSIYLAFYLSIFMHWEIVIPQDVIWIHIAQLLPIPYIFFRNGFMVSMIVFFPLICMVFIRLLLAVFIYVNFYVVFYYTTRFFFLQFSVMILVTVCVAFFDFFIIWRLFPYCY